MTLRPQAKIIRALHVVKTADGALWAASQVGALVRCGVEVHVAVPRLSGRAIPHWERTGATLHVADLDLPVRTPWIFPRVRRVARELIDAVQPDIIHSHFFGTTIALRMALGKTHRMPRIFQVPGPLHLEHSLYRNLDRTTAGPTDAWIGSSKCITNQYLAQGVNASRVFLSYYGAVWPPSQPRRAGGLRSRFGIEDSQIVVGNANYIYPPKWFLGQRVGLKCHEDVIDALGLVLRARSDVVGVLIGGTFGSGRFYEKRLRARARSVGNGRIKMPGFLPPAEVLDSWPGFDCAVHAPLSENCGGVIEPLSAGVPTIASRVGGLTEVVMDGLTGKTVTARNPAQLASAILEVLNNLDHYRTLAKTGQQLVRTTFDVDRTAQEILQIYRHVLDSSVPRPPEFDTAEYAATLARGMVAHC